MLEFTCSFVLDFDGDENKRIFNALKDKKEYNAVLKNKLFFTIKQPSLAKLRAISNSLLRDLTIITRVNTLIEEE
ncbi:Uncharacterised protein [uncultured archaeon]|nr:Uncharacterised protein [uncultured archaeon]